MNIDKILNEEEMQELAVDYAFGKLSKNETIIFENNLKNFPKIENEVIEIRSAFSKISKADIKEHIDKRTANLSYKINQKRFAKEQSKLSKKSILKFALPVIALLIAIFVITDLEKPNPHYVINKEITITEAEAGIIFGSENKDIFLYDPYFNEFYNNQITNSELETTGIINTSTNGTVYNYLNEMSDSEFNELIEELDNENFDI